LPRVAVFLGFDVRIKGGLITMAEAFIEALRSLGVTADLYMLRLVGSSRRELSFVPVDDDGRRWLSAPTVRGVPNVLAPLLPALTMRKRFAEYDVVQTIVGAGVWALPGLAGRKNVCWIATPIEEEMRSRVRADTILRRMGYEALLQFENFAERAVLRRCDRIIALSANTRDTLARRHGLDARRIEVLYSPIDEGIFHPPASPPSGEVCVTTSRLDDERKNVPMLIEAFGIVGAARPLSRLRLVGPYDNNGAVARAVAASPIRERIELVGFVNRSEIGAQLRVSDVFVLPSKQEGLGIVALEAMACGLPVISFCNGGTDEIVRDSGAGILVERRGPRELADAMIGLLQDADERRRLGRRGEVFVRAHASTSAFRDGIARVYRELGFELSGN
jgi:glycosyltransferase involved in cell wall biosynthesis